MKTNPQNKENVKLFCPGDDTEKEKCNKNQCPGTKTFNDNETLCDIILNHKKLEDRSIHCING